ncbi:LL-diaminopimelate aminotransferase [Candidatus Daviesbacteria bacterium]|nr:LL-diaminopimelate aminotransferase [Candidatus Daviesbacteria bacterium]
MAKINSNYRKLPKSYLFSEIAKRTEAFLEKNPKVEILKLGIGNTTEPLAPSVIDGLINGVKKLAKLDSYTGYGDEQGDSRLRQALSDWYKHSLPAGAGKKRGINLLADEIFISDGAKPDAANISSIFSPDSVVAITDPVYPVYLDSNVIAGKKIVYLSADEKNGFIPTLPKQKVDLIFLCFPNNPTGAVATKKQLKEFVDYATGNRAVIIFDAAYSEYIKDKNLPTSIYEIKGAKSCAIELQSFSKSAGFTGVRLGWTVVPKDLIVEGSQPGEINQFWHRRQTTMFNGASNIAQEGGLAILSAEGQKQTRKQVNYYMENAAIIKRGLKDMGLTVFGGENAPYLWVKCPEGLSSWEFFDKLLKKAHVVGTPGSGFGQMGEGYLRLSAFGHRENVRKAMISIKENLNL